MYTNNSTNYLSTIWKRSTFNAFNFFTISNNHTIHRIIVYIAKDEKITYAAVVAELSNSAMTFII